MKHSSFVLSLSMAALGLVAGLAAGEPEDGEESRPAA
jgi:hypothetical protein